MQTEPLFDIKRMIPLFVALLVGFAYYLGTLTEKVKYDMPEDFNIHTISRDSWKPTKMEVIYSEEEHQFLFRFADTIIQKP